MTFLSEGLALMWLHLFEAYRRFDFLEGFFLKLLFTLPLAFAEKFVVDNWKVSRYETDFLIPESQYVSQSKLTCPHLQLPSFMSGAVAPPRHLPIPIPMRRIIRCQFFRRSILI